jgi:hypothetical protein
MGTGSNQNRVQINENLLDGGTVLAIVGLFLLAFDTLLGGSAFWYAGRRWVRAREHAPSDTVNVILGQLGSAASAGVKAASGAGPRAWNEGSVAA